MVRLLKILKSCGRSSYGRQPQLKYRQ